MSNKLVPKIILEGTRLTHKTEIAFALNEHPRLVGPRKYRYHSPLISAEWCAFTNFPWGRGLINFLPEEEAQAMETYHVWARLFELQKYYSWIIDRFHISTRMYQLRARGKDYDFTWLEQRLQPLGFRLVFVTRSPESQDALFDTWRFHAFFTTTDPNDLDTVAADKTHRGHAIIEQVHVLHLPIAWPWQHPWTALFTHSCGPPAINTT